MERVLIDMDNVLADFDAKVFSDLKRMHPDLEKKTRCHQLFGKDYPEYADDINEIIYGRGFYASLPVMKSAVSGLSRIIEHKMEPVVCSTPLNNQYCIEDKQLWLKREFVPIFGKKILESAEFVLDKTKSEGVALIDDGVKILDQASLANWDPILFKREYSRNVSRYPLSIDDWNDTGLDTILRMIGDKNE